MKIIEDFELKDITTFHLNAKTKFFCEYSSIEDLIKLLRWDVCKSLPIFHIGGGSNLVFTKDFDGAILHSNIQFIKTIDEDQSSITLEVGSGVNWDDFVSYCVSNNYYGAENMSFIPGEVGASAVQNIGSYGAEVKDIITKVNAIEISSTDAKSFSNKECKYAYRDSVFKNEYKDRYVITSVEYKLSKIPTYNLSYGPLKKFIGTDISLAEIRNEIIRIRKEKLPDPNIIGSVGSFFKNPIIPISEFDKLVSLYPEIPNYYIDENDIKIPAAWLIEHAGMKGFSIGDAQTYKSQCLVIVNNGNATAQDVKLLYTTIIEKVKQLFGIELCPEANIL